MKIITIFLIVILIAFSVGCWDYKEIEDRGYVLGIAIDTAEKNPKGYEDTKSYIEEKKLEKIPLQKGEPKYAYTIQIPVLPKAQVKPVGTSGGGGEESKRTWDLTILGNSFFEINREFSTRLDYPPFYEHLQAVVISEEVAKEGISRPLDMIIRDPEMRRRTKVFITPQEAHKILDVTPRIDDYASIYLSKLPENAFKTSRMAHLTDLGVVSESIHSNLDFVLPKVVSTEDEIKDSGVAVFKGDKMVGYLEEIHTIYAKWIRNLVKGGIILTEYPGKEESIVTLEINSVKTKVRPLVNGENIKISIKSKATVNIAEETNLHYVDSLNEKFIKTLESVAEKTVTLHMQNAIKRVQELGADFLHFNVSMQRYKPKVWEKVKDDWDEIFKDLKADIDVDITIKRIGIVK